MNIKEIRDRIENIYIMLNDIEEELEKSYDPTLDMPITNSKLSKRTKRCLHQDEIHTIRDLINRDEKHILSIKDLGYLSFMEIRDMIREMGLTFQKDIKVC